MLNKNRINGLTGLAISLAIVAFVAHDVRAQDDLEAYQEGMKTLFQNDPDLKKMIEEFLDHVPSSHTSRNHANRFFMLGHKKISRKKSKVKDQHSNITMPDNFLMREPIVKQKTLNLVRKADSYDNEVKRCLGRIFKMHNKKCSIACEEWPCPRAPSDDVCPMDSICKLEGSPCVQCAPCPLPEYCLPPPVDEKCPPPPVCPDCNASNSTIKTEKIKPNNAIVSTITNTTTNTNSDATSSASSTNTSSNTSSNTQQQEIPPEIIDDMMFILTAQRQQTEKPVILTTATNSSSEIITRTPTTCPPCPCMTTPPPKLRVLTSTIAPIERSESTTTLVKPVKIANDYKVDKEHKQSSQNYTQHETTKDGSKYVSNSTFTTSTTTKTQGCLKFEKNIGLMVKDEEARRHILSMLDATPDKTGGKLMALGSVLLSKLGDPLPPPVQGKRGVGRTFSYVNSRHATKSVVGHVLDEYRRKKCLCKSCVVTRKLESCKCEAKSCPAKLPLCSSCPKDPVCPAPKGCPAHPPCKNCRQLELEDFNFDGNEADLDDVDPENPVTNDEEVVPCKGVTCPFKKNCGSAPLNPLTPKKSQSGYMVGGENEIYGEWPSFVRIDIHTKEGLSGLCGGVLITNRHVLTAGHCVAIPPKDTSKGTNYTRLPQDAFKVVLADHDRHKKDAHEIHRTLSKICYSSKFNDPKLEGSRYDYAILTLNESVPFNDNIQPACLPYEPMGKSDKCFVVGLGITHFEKSFGNHSFPEIIQKMPVKRVSCKNWGIKHDDRSRHCFTKAKGKGDTCGGDSGGPILCKNKNRWVVNGLVSYGSETCDGSEVSGWVAVYTRLHALMKNINDDCLAATRPIRHMIGRLPESPPINTAFISAFPVRK